MTFLQNQQFWHHLILHLLFSCVQNRVLNTESSNEVRGFGVANFYSWRHYLLYLDGLWTGSRHLKPNSTEMRSMLWRTTVHCVVCLVLYYTVKHFLPHNETLFLLETMNQVPQLGPVWHTDVRIACLITHIVKIINLQKKFSLGVCLICWP